MPTQNQIDEAASAVAREWDNHGKEAYFAAVYAAVAEKLEPQPPRVDLDWDQMLRWAHQETAAFSKNGRHDLANMTAFLVRAIRAGRGMKQPTFISDALPEDEVDGGK